MCTCNINMITIRWSINLIYLSVVLEGDLCWVLLPRLPIYLHGHRACQLDLDLPGLADPVRLAQPHLHLGNVETGVNTEHLKFLIREAGGEVELLVAGAQLPGLDPSPPVWNVQDYHGL